MRRRDHRTTESSRDGNLKPLENGALGYRDGGCSLRHPHTVACYRCAASKREKPENVRETLAGRVFRMVSGGTETHLLLVYVYKRGIMGRDAEKWLEQAGITVNKNAIPFDQLPPLKASGIRLGTPALTTRGMKEAEMELIGNWIADVLEKLGDESLVQRIRNQVSELTARFPLYTHRLNQEVAAAPPVR